MPYIKVNTDRIKTYTTELEASRKTINRIKEDFSDLRHSLDWDIKSASSIDRRLNQNVDALTTEVKSLSNMSNFLSTAIQKYDGQTKSQEERAKELDKQIKNTQSGFRKGYDAFRTLYQPVKAIWDYIDFSKNLIQMKNISFLFKNGKVIVSGFKRGSGWGGLYNFSTWKNKMNGLNGLDKFLLGLDIGLNVVDTGFRLYDVWTDQNKTTEKKVYDTVANVGCTGAAITASVAGAIASKAAGTAATVALTPIIGPFAPIAGVVVGAVTGHAIGSLSSALTSEEVVSQASSAVEKVVGTAKAGAQTISNAAKEVAEAKGLTNKAMKTAELVGTAVVETTKVAVTAAVETVKTQITVVKQTVKNFFKGW